jgi:hypothetical protein
MKKQNRAKNGLTALTHPTQLLMYIGSIWFVIFTIISGHYPNLLILPNGTDLTLIIPTVPTAFFTLLSGCIILIKGEYMTRFGELVKGKEAHTVGSFRILFSVVITLIIIIANTNIK